jgi:hypothetical protein
MLLFIWVVWSVPLDHSISAGNWRDNCVNSVMLATIEEGNRAMAERYCDSLRDRHSLGTQWLW